MRDTPPRSAVTLWVRVALLAACAGLGAPRMALAQSPSNAPAGDAVFQRACASCHVAGAATAPTPAALRQLAPEAIVTSLTSGRMRVQGEALSADERRAVAEYLTGAHGGRREYVRRRAMCRVAAARRNGAAGAGLERVGQRRGQHALPVVVAGGPRGRGRAEAAVEVGVRVSGRARGAHPAGRGRRTGVHGQRGWRRLRARRAHGLHALGVPGARGGENRHDGRAVRRRRGRHALCAVLWRRARHGLRGGRRHRP